MRKDSKAKKLSATAMLLENEQCEMQKFFFFFYYSVFDPLSFFLFFCRFAANRLNFFPATKKKSQKMGLEHRAMWQK